MSGGTPTGSYVTVARVEAYIARPQTPNGAAIIISTDVFGHKFKNTQIIADKFAEAGYLTVVPDQFAGKPLPASLMERFLFLTLPRQSPTFLQAHFLDPVGRVFLGVGTMFKVLPWFVANKPPSKMPMFEQLISELRSGALGPVDKIGIQGYCYGGATCLALGSREDSLIDAFAVAHTQISVPKDFESIKKPALFVAADHDWAFPKKEFQAAEDIVKKNGMQDRVRLSFYPGTFHGFATRGSDDDPVVSEAKTKAFAESLLLFNSVLAQKPDVTPLVAA
ncbi:MAG: hypothetical protein WDW36_006189 [Sanguina aurantia]